MKMVSIVSLVLFPLMLMAQSTETTVKIGDATAVRLSLMESISSATNTADDLVRFEVTDDVRAENAIAIPRGATAVGHVVEVEPRRRLGRAGKLNLSIDYVKAPDGSNVRLRASSARKGDDKTGTVIIGTILLSPLFLIMRGKDINIPRGTEFMAYVDGDRVITLPHSPVTVSTAVLSVPSTPATVASTIQANLGIQTATVPFIFTPDSADKKGVDGKIPADSKIYVNANNGFDIFLSAAFRSKGVRLQFTPSPDKADYILDSSLFRSREWLETQRIGSHPVEEAAFKLISRSGDTVWAYAVTKGYLTRGMQSIAEACAKHLRNRVESETKTAPNK
jgi:hypothetical protein